MSEFPEHDKLEAVQAETQFVGDFLEWAEGEGLQLMAVDDGRPYGVDWMRYLAKWVGVDEAKLEAERRTMITQARGER